MQGALGGREDEVVDEPAVAGDGLRADAGESGPDVGAAQLRHVARGGRDEGRAEGRVADLVQAGPPPSAEEAPGARPGKRAAEPGRAEQRRRADQDLAVDRPVRWTPRKGSEGSGTG